MIITHIRHNPCTHTEPELKHPNITSPTFTFTLTSSPHPNSNEEIGFISAHLLHKSSMKSPDSQGMWAECRVFDAAHAPEAKLHKVANYLSNECFYAEKEALIEEVAWVLYIEKVYLYPAHRGKSLGLLAVEEVIRTLCLDGEKCVVMLEPGAIAPPNREADWNDVYRQQANETEGEDVESIDATEKIRRHWKRMGFAEWSYTDEAWLLLFIGERPRIEDVVQVLKMTDNPTEIGL